MPLSLPYTQLALGGAAVLLLAALCWAFYRWGRSAERARTLKIILDAERRITKALDSGRQNPVNIDDEWLRRPSKNE